MVAYYSKILCIVNSIRSVVNGIVFIGTQSESIEHRYKNDYCRRAGNRRDKFYQPFSEFFGKDRYALAFMPCKICDCDKHGYIDKEQKIKP